MTNKTKYVGPPGLGLPHPDVGASGLLSFYSILPTLPGFVKRAVRKTHRIEKRNRRRQARYAAKRELFSD